LILLDQVLGTADARARQLQSMLDAVVRSLGREPQLIDTPMLVAGCYREHSSTHKKPGETRDD